MTRQETSAIMDILRAAFPAYYRKIDPQEAKAAIALWAEMFAGDDVRDVAVAVKSLIATRVEGYPPTIGAVKEAMYKTHDHGLSETDAWNLVTKALKNGTYGAKKEFDKLPPECQRVVGSPEQLKIWAQMPPETVESVVGSHFRRIYRERAQSEKEYSMLPEDVKTAIEGVSRRMLNE